MNKHIFLFSFLITPLLITTMDTTTYTTPISIINHYSKVNQLCSSTCKFLHTLSLSNNSDEFSKKATSQLLNIIEQMKNLKEATPPIQEKEIGVFMYQTKFELPVTEIVRLDKPLQLKTSQPVFATLFFARLAAYNNHLSQNQLLSPNNQQIISYQEKQEIERIVNKNRIRNILIPSQVITDTTISIPGNAAIEAFMSLLKDTQNIIKDSPQEIEQSVALVYYYELKNKQTSS